MGAAASHLASFASGQRTATLLLQPQCSLIFLFRYLEFNQPPLIEVKLSKKEIIGRLKQQKDNIRESKPQAQQVAATLSIQNIYTHTS
jgi:hypothetical protein